MSKITDAAARKARSGLRNLKRLGRREFSCACGCGKQWRDYRLMNAHFYKAHGGYWAGRAGKATARSMGKGMDGARRMARGTREAFGHVDRKGTPTDKARSRPGYREDDGHLKIRDLRARHRHGKEHDRAEAAERKHAARADRHEARGRDARADISRGRAADATYRLRTAWPVRPRPADTAPARTAPQSRANGHRPAPARTRTP